MCVCECVRAYVCIILHVYIYVCIILHVYIYIYVYIYISCKIKYCNALYHNCIHTLINIYTIIFKDSIYAKLSCFDMVHLKCT